MVEACGALFEEHEMRVDKCTHLITTEAYLKKTSLPSKIKDAASKGREIVTLAWLLQSIEKGYLVDTKDFKLETAKTARLRLQATTVKVPLEFRQIIVDEETTGYSEGFTVWVHKGVVWDATLVRLVAQNLGETKSRLVIRRSQLLHDPKAKKYYTFMLEKAGGKVYQTSRLGQGKLEEAKDIFQGIFYDATGLHWEFRDDDPKKNKSIYAKCNFSDEEDSLSVLGTKPYPPAIKAVLDLIIRSGSEQIPQLMKKCLEKNTGGPVMLGKSAVSIHQLRVGMSLLKQLLERPKFANEIVTGTWPASSVLKIYQRLIGSEESKSPASLEWIQREQDFLSYLHILTMASNPGLPVGWVESRLKTHLHQLLGLKHMTLVEKFTKEYQALERYFKFSDYSSVYGDPSYGPTQVKNIFRIERLTESDRFIAWTKQKCNDQCRLLLWHGSGNNSFSGILAKGLLGYIREPRIFLSGLAGYSASYCFKRGIIPGQTALMLLCEVSIHQARHIPQGGMCDAECIHPDLQGIKMLKIAPGENYSRSRAWAVRQEYSFSKPDGIRMRYLFEFEIQNAKG
ncbi:hypothetical protein N7490_010864 [Penicillium lividum]|nr:hypothetical protein N7490_010864 [Penicillium lividum]